MSTSAYDVEAYFGIAEKASYPEVGLVGMRIDLSDNPRPPGTCLGKVH